MKNARHARQCLKRYRWASLPASGIWTAVISMKISPSHAVARLGNGKLNGAAGKNSERNLIKSGRKTRDSSWILNLLAPKTRQLVSFNSLRPGFAALLLVLCFLVHGGRITGNSHPEFRGHQKQHHHCR